MKNPSEPDDRASLLDKLAGLGEGSFRKTYYPELQQRLEELERLKAFIDHSNDIMLLIQVPSGRIIDATASASRQTGWSRDDLLSQSIFEVSELAGCPDADALITATVADGAEHALVTTLFRRRDGGAFPVEITLNRTQFNDDVCVLAVARDITDRKRAEEALARSEAFLKNIVDNIPAMVFAKEAKDLRYVTLNKAGAELLGYAEEELLGKNDYDFFPGEQAAFFTTKDREVLASGELVEIPEEKVTTRQGDELIVRTKKIPLYDEQGSAAYLLGISEDITERRRLEEQLLQSQKMDAIGQLAGGVAHDFNNLLMVIMGYASTLHLDKELDPQQKEKTKHILAAADRAAILTRSLLTFSRKQVMQLRKTNLNDIVENIKTLLERVIGEDIQLTTNLEHRRLDVEVDCSQIEQVLVNLATNARDAMPTGGILTIETGSQVIDPLFVQYQGAGEPGTYAVVSVSDTGFGMDEQTRKRIFEPFYTTKEVGKGTGLGMAIVYGIVKQHHGFINVYSEPGIGTTFRIYLPLATQEAAGEQAVPLAPPARGTETILVAEDDAAVRELVRDILAEYGYTVVLAVDGKDAVEKFAEARDSIDLVLMDIIMPKMSGKEACDGIRKLRPGARVIYTSGYTMDIIKSRNVLGDVELVMKPVQPGELLRKVREVLDS